MDAERLSPGSVLERGKSVKGAFVFETPVPLNKGWELHLTTVKGIPPAEFVHGRLPTFEPGMLELRTMISVHGLGGASKLTDNMGLDQAAWGRVTGAGVQVYYGPSKRTALVGGADFVRTSSTAIDMAPGRLETRATGGRLHIGGRLHTGEWLVPYAQAGLGFMFAQHTFDMGGARDSEFRVAMLGSIGVGVEAWFGERVVVGLGVNGTAPIGGDDTGLVVEGGGAQHDREGRGMRVWPRVCRDPSVHVHKL